MSILPSAVKYTTKILQYSMKAIFIPALSGCGLNQTHPFRQFTSCNERLACATSRQPPHNTHSCTRYIASLRLPFDSPARIRFLNVCSPLFHCNAEELLAIVKYARKFAIKSSWSIYIVIELMLAGSMHSWNRFIISRSIWDRTLAYLHPNLGIIKKPLPRRTR